MAGNFSKSNLYKLFATISIIAILPILFMIFRLRNQSISDNISDWSDFGGFISGTTNTLISIFSFIVLSYLTYFVGQQSTEENKNVNLLMRKLDAYDALASHMPRFNIFAHEFSRIGITVLRELGSEEKSPQFEEKVSKLIEKISYINELNYFIYSFRNRYGHLFKYNFSDDNHILLLNVMEKVNQNYQELCKSLESEKVIAESVNLDNMQELSTRLGQFMATLREELR